LRGVVLRVLKCVEDSAANRCCLQWLLIVAVLVLALIWCIAMSEPASDIKGQPLSALRTPLLVVQRAVVQRNCARMLRTCSELGVRLRAQTKTHKTIEGARLQTGGALRGLVCSTVKEVEFYAQAGASDVLLGHPLAPHCLPELRPLLRTLPSLHVMVDNLPVCRLLSSEEGAPPVGARWSVYLKLDCGKQRAGVWHKDVDLAVEIMTLLQSSPQIDYQGLYVHCGDTYAATSVADVCRIRDQNIERLLAFVRAAEARGVRGGALGVGSTPSCLHPCPAMASLHELHPGNYAFCDTQQMALGSCKEEDIAACVATRVIGHYPRRNQLLLDCGFTALTKQGRSASGYGLIRGHPGLRLAAMDQEHGFVEPIDPNCSIDWAALPVGHMLFVLPYHSCATAAQHEFYAVVEGVEQEGGEAGVREDAVVVEVWRPTRGW